MPPKAGRRAAEEDTTTEPVESPQDEQEQQEAPKPSVKQGGWGEDKPKSGRRATESGADEDTQEDVRLQMTTPDVAAKADDSDDDAPAIPDLDQAQAGVIASQVADAPATTVQISAIADLDKDLVTTLPFSQTESGIDLKLLSNVLNTPDVIVEADETWDFVHIFTEIKSELQTETEAKEAKNDTTDDSPAGDLPL